MNGWLVRDKRRRSWLSGDEERTEEIRITSSRSQSQACDLDPSVALRASPTGLGMLVVGRSALTWMVVSVCGLLA